MDVDLRFSSNITTYAVNGTR